MKLSYKDRLVIPQLLPVRSSLASQLTARDIRNKVELTSKELEVANVRVEEGQFLWDDKAAKVKTITFDAEQLALLVEQVEGLNEREEISSDWVDLCEKIIKHQTKEK